MKETTMLNQMYDTLEALPPGITAAWLANYHFHTQNHFTRAECLTLAKIAIQG